MARAFALVPLIDVCAAILCCLSFLMLVVLVARDAAADCTEHTMMGHVTRNGTSHTARETANCHGRCAEPNRDTQRKQGGHRDAHLHYHLLFEATPP
jgi:hypothetical protein